jgi:hypothetical protein
MATRKAKTHVTDTATQPNTHMSALDAYTTTFDATANALEGRKVIRPSKLKGPLTFRVVPAHMDWADGVPGATGIVRTGPFVHHFKHIYRDPNDPTGKGYIAFDCPERNGAGLACPSCARSKLLRASADKVDQDLGWDMAASREVMVNVLVRSGDQAGEVMTLLLSAPSGKPQGKTMYERLLAASAHPTNGGDIVHPLEGYDVVLTKNGSDYQFSLARQPSRLAPGDGDILAMINNQPDLLTMLAADVQAGKQKALDIANPGHATQVITQGRPPAGALSHSRTAEDDIYGETTEVEDLDY